MPERKSGWTCAVCHKRIPAHLVGRPAKWCSESCRLKARRAKERLEERASLIAAGAMVESDLPACHVCGMREATVGLSERPLLCRYCSQAAA